MKELEIVDAETLLYNPLGQVEFIIEDILPYKTFALHFKLEDGKRSCIVENYK